MTDKAPLISVRLFGVALTEAQNAELLADLRAALGPTCPAVQDGLFGPPDENSTDPI